MNEVTVIEKIATLISAIRNCRKTCNREWEQRHQILLDCIIERYLPDGAGFDRGTQLSSRQWAIALERTGKMDTYPALIWFQTAFHHMDQYGGFAQWTEHEVIVRPSFVGVNIQVKRKNLNGIKEFIAEEFNRCLNLPCKMTYTDCKDIDLD